MTQASKARARAQPESRELYYGGKWHAARSGATLAVSDPATGAELGVVADAGADDVAAAVAAARAAFPGWRDTPVKERARMLREAAAILRANGEELARIDALDSGNPIRSMRADVEMSVDYLEYFAGLITELKGSTTPIAPAIFNYTLREPLGVIGRIGAFNHPVLFSAGKTGAPLGAGNTLIVKPAEQTPMSALRLAELWHDVFPPGVFNVVTGGRGAGEALVAHPQVAKIGFIGSIAAGRAVMRTASATLKPLTMELSGKNALIACGDCDPEAVAQGVIKGMNFYSVAGQSCNSTSRAFIHADIYDAVAPRVAKLASAIKVGLPTNPETEMGCLSSKPQFEKSLGYIEIALKEGAKLLCGGKRAEGPELAHGFFVKPTVFANVTPDMRIAREEVFGPVLSLLKWTDVDEVVERVNELEHGLTASIWTRDISRGHQLASRIDAGFQWLNDVSSHYLGVPFGGFKQSGFGKDESFEEMIECTRVKNVNVRL
jgi:betaine-aldehyde dehydrogenase